MKTAEVTAELLDLSLISYIPATGQIEPLTDFDRLYQQAKTFAAESHSKNTLRAYNSMTSSFIAWCSTRNIDPLHISDREALVGLYISDSANRLKSASLTATVAAIRHYFHSNNLSLDTGHPAIASTLKGIRRVKGSRQTRKAPITIPDLRAMITALPITLLGTRDRALLLLGFAGAFRRSELVSLDIEDLELTHEGYRVLLKQSKTDQEKIGIEKAIPYGRDSITCPVLAIQSWLAASKLNKGPLFRSIDRHSNIGRRLSDRAVAEIVKRSPALDGRSDNFSGHSLRAGLITAAAAARAPEHIIQAQSGHKSREMLQRYIRTGLQFKDNAAGIVGL